MRPNGLCAETVALQGQRQLSVGSIEAGPGNHRGGVDEFDLAMSRHSIRVAAERHGAGDAAAAEAAIDVVERDHGGVEMHGSRKVACDQRRRKDHPGKLERHTAIHGGERAGADFVARRRRATV